VIVGIEANVMGKPKQKRVRSNVFGCAHFCCFWNGH